MSTYFNEKLSFIFIGFFINGVNFLFSSSGSRITTFFNFGYVALTIKYVTIHDVGVYTCRAYNRAGEAHTTAQLSVISKNDVIYDSQHPGGLQKIQNLEDSSRYSRQVRRIDPSNQVTILFQIHEEESFH